MRFLFTISLCILVSACGKADYKEPDQRTRIENYLNGLKLEFVNQNGVFKYTKYTAGNTPAAGDGDTVYFYFSGYTFSTGIITGGTLNKTYLFTTNIGEDADSARFDRTYIDFEPRMVTLGSGDGLLQGIQLGIEGSAVADTVYLFMASDLAYGSIGKGVVPPGSPVAFKIVINKIVTKI